MSNADHILFFDGQCPFCNRMVIFIMKKDDQKRLKFAPLEGETAREVLGDEYEKFIKMDTVVISSRGELYVRSRAALEALKMVKGWQNIAGILLWVPTVIRDGIYRLIAKYRLKIWDTCPMIPEEYREVMLP